MGEIVGKFIRGYKEDELKDLDKRGLACAATVPINPRVERDMKILNMWCDWAKQHGSPYIVTQMNGEYNKIYKPYILWKEDKALRCNKCGGYLNARPQKRKAGLTHNDVGKRCNPGKSPFVRKKRVEPNDLPVSHRRRNQRGKGSN